MTDDDRRILRAFCRVVRSIEKHSLVAGDKLRAGFAASAGPDFHVHHSDLPDMDLLRSLMLDFRKVLNSNDDSNVMKACNIPFRGSGRNDWTDDERSRVASLRKAFNAAFDQPADFYSGNEQPTVRDLLDGWINGDWFHPDENAKTEREASEFAQGHDLSLHLIVPALRVAIEGLKEMRLVLCERSQP